MSELSRLSRLAVNLGRGLALSAKVASRVLPLFEANFVRLAGSNRNRFGARGGFWNRMLSGTKAVVTDQAAIIRMPREVRLRHLGGTVRPKAKKYLAIPQAAEAYGRTPRQFDDLRVVRVRGALLLVQHAAFGRKGAVRTMGTVLYTLVRSATIRPQADVLPAPEKINAAALSAARAVVNEAITGNRS